MQLYGPDTLLPSDVTQPLNYANPLQTPRNATFDPYSPQNYYQAAELFTFISPTRDVFSDKDSVDRTVVTWKRTSQYLPWMKMVRRSYVKRVRNCVNTRLCVYTCAFVWGRDDRKREGGGCEKMMVFFSSFHLLFLLSLLLSFFFVCIGKRAWLLAVFFRRIQDPQLHVPASSDTGGHRRSCALVQARARAFLLSYNPFRDFVDVFQGKFSGKRK